LTGIFVGLGGFRKEPGKGLIESDDREVVRKETQIPFGNDEQKRVVGQFEKR